MPPTPDHHPDRQSLAAQQAALIAALTSAAPLPPDFNPAHLARTAAMLLNKRSHEALAHLPLTARRLAPHASSLFTTYARTLSYPPRGGPATDAYRFLQWLRQNHHPLAPEEWKNLRRRHRPRFLSWLP